MTSQKPLRLPLTVAKKVTSVSMPNYIGSSLEFTKNNLTQIVGVKEANIEVIEYRLLLKEQQRVQL